MSSFGDPRTIHLYNTIKKLEIFKGFRRVRKVTLPTYLFPLETVRYVEGMYNRSTDVKVKGCPLVLLEVSVLKLVQ